MAKQFDIAVYVGRFQPFHKGHLSVLEKCEKIASSVLVLVGSSFRPRTFKNPFTYIERAQMVEASANSLGMPVNIRPLNDFFYQEGKWQEEVIKQVDGFVDTLNLDHPPKIAIVGHNKDQSSYYLEAFPEWTFVETGSFEGISATPIRDCLLDTVVDFPVWKNLRRKFAEMLPESTIEWMEEPVEFMLGRQCHRVDAVLSNLREEYYEVAEYKERWADAPYPPTFVTADAVVTANGHVLLVKRRKAPGAGLWAIPGGFVDQKESVYSACLRELKEETGLDILGGSDVDCLTSNTKVFDAPDRSSRGRVITIANHFNVINMEGTLPEVKGGDDASEARWVPLEEVHSEFMFEDHFDIIQSFEVR